MKKRLLMCLHLGQRDIIFFHLKRKGIDISEIENIAQKWKNREQYLVDFTASELQEKLKEYENIYSKLQQLINANF